MRYVIMILCLFSTIAHAGYVSDDDSLTVYDRQTQDFILFDVDPTQHTLIVLHTNCSKRKLHAYEMSVNGYSFRTIGRCIDNRMMSFRAYDHDTDSDLLEVAEKLRVYHVKVPTLNLTSTIHALD